MAGLTDPYNTFDHNRPSDPLLDLYRSPLSEHQAKPFASFLPPPPGLQDQAADDEAKFARGGHGIFGEPMVRFHSLISYFPRRIPMLFYFIPNFYI